MNNYSSNLLKVTELAHLSKLGISPSDVNWSQVKLTSEKWISILHTTESFLPASPLSSSYTGSSTLNNNHLFNHRFSWNDQFTYDSNFTLIDVNTNITLVNPYTNDTKLCHTCYGTKCAQVNPQEDIIALSNDKFISVYNFKTGNILRTFHFQAKCLFWCWITRHKLALITDTEVYHCDIESSFNPLFMFRLNDKIKNCQIVSYKTDKLKGLWFAISGLYTESEGEITGIVQIYSKSYKISQVIEAHAINFTTYKFNGNSNATNVFLAAKRTNQLSNSNQVKIYIIELGPVVDGNSALISRIESVKWFDPIDGRYDFPVSIECSTEFGLIYILSKYGTIYICDVESGAFLLKRIVSSNCLFVSLLDFETQGLIAIAKSGQVLSIDLDFNNLIHFLKKISKNDIAFRIKQILDQQSDCDMVTRL